MKKPEIFSIFEVTDFKTGESWKEFREGMGQETVRLLRAEYPRFSKIVLEGFEVEGNFRRINLFTHNSIR